MVPGKGTPAPTPANEPTPAVVSNPPYTYSDVGTGFSSLGKH